MITQREEAYFEGDNKIRLKVAGGSDSKKVAGAIVKYMQEGNDVSIIAMGAGAVNQAVKSIAISRGMVASKGWNISCIPGFTDVEIDGVRKSAITFQILR